MLPAEIVYFAVTLFLSLTALVCWKRRHDLVAARLNKGLRGYVDAKKTPAAAAESTPADLIPA